MTSVVTSGAGFLGSHLVDALVRRRESVVAIDSLATGRLEHLENSLLSGRLTFIYLDSETNHRDLRAALADSGINSVRRVFHISPNEPSSASTDEVALRQVRDATIAAVEFALEYGARLVLATTSNETYVPTRSESSNSFPTVADTITHDSNHAELDACPECIVGKAVVEHHLDARIVRSLNCFGPRMSGIDGDQLSGLLEASNGRLRALAAKSVNDRFPTLYVNDAIELLLLAAEGSQSGLRAIEVCSEHDESFVHVAETIDAPTLRQSHGELNQSCSLLNVAERLGWKPETCFGEGLLRTYDWFSRSRQQFA